MKTKLLLILLSSIFSFLLSPVQAQVPQGFNYQAVARDGSGNLIRNTPMPVRITIQSDSLGGTIFWQELHPAVVTSDIGIINLVLGKGARQSAATLAAFTDIDWRITPKFLTLEMNHNGWKTMGTTRLWSVPYAAVAGDLAGSVKKLSVEGETMEPEEALFEVRNRDGQIIFAVYNDGVRVYVNDGAKALKGGFAVGGFGTDKAESQKYLFVTKDSTRIYVDNDPNNKKAKGGFAVGGFDATKGPVIPFLNLTPNNYFIGHESGMNNDSGLYNSTLGYQAGKFTSGGDANIFIGYQAGFSNKVGSDNTFVGYQAGFSNIGNNYPGVFQHGKWNCYFGYKAGYSSTYGDFNTLIGFEAGLNNQASLNTFIGHQSGYSTTEGGHNTFIGVSAGRNNTLGNSNIFMGNLTGYGNTEGENNIYIGAGAGAYFSTGNNNIVIGDHAGSGTVYSGTGIGSNNVLLGFEAGKYSFNGSSNVFIGNQAGYNEAGSNILYIENSSAATPLVYGNFTTNDFRINGDIEYTGTIASVSDIRLKKNIRELGNVLEKLELIDGIYYEWDKTDTAGLLFQEGTQIGVIAQDVEKVYPELVITNDRGFKMVDYVKLTPVLLEAVKEQQKQIKAFSEENDNLRSELEIIRKKVENIEALFTEP